MKTKKVFNILFPIFLLVFLITLFCSIYFMIPKLNNIANAEEISNTRMTIFLYGNVGGMNPEYNTNVSRTATKTLF